MKNGYTLLETVVYIAILAVIAVMALGSIFSIYRALGQTLVERKLILNGDVALETMIREIRAASSVDPSSVLGTHPGTLKVGSKTFSPSNFTTSDVSVTNLIFYATSTANSAIVKIELSLQAGSGVFQKTKNFYGSAVMRGAY